MDFLVIFVALAYIVYTPFTKVEESFNMQAVHDIIYLGFNLSQYDHHEFPGVVPRTFIGPIIISIISSPFVLLFEYFELHKFWTQYVVRLIITIFVTLSWMHLKGILRRNYGEIVANWYTLITISQFHFMFYMSRLLPNIMALPLVLLSISFWLRGCKKRFILFAGSAIILFRFEVAIFLGLLLAYDISIKKAFINEYLKIISGIGLILLTSTVIIDSFFWRRPLWPEGEVLWYNTILNKSSNWGVSPYLWYIYSAIPRAMGLSIIFALYGLYVEIRTRTLGIAALAFVLIYSVLPHKELRFIIYVFPVLNISAATACHRLWSNKGKSFWRSLLALTAGGHLIFNTFLSIFLLIISSTNYPGGISISRLHRIAVNESNISIHICNLAAQTGVTKFTQIRHDWSYSKKENLSFDSEEFKSFDYVLIEAQNKLSSSWIRLLENYEPLEYIDCFSNIGVSYQTIIPFKIKMKACIVIMRKKKYSPKINKSSIKRETENNNIQDNANSVLETVTKKNSAIAENKMEVHEENILITDEDITDKNVPDINQIHFEDVDLMDVLNVQKLRTSNPVNKRTKLQKAIENHFQSEGSTFEPSPEINDNKRNPKNVIKNIIKKEKIKELVEKISQMDINSVCNIEKMTVKKCLTELIKKADKM